jgi:hypothetical protein
VYVSGSNLHYFTKYSGRTPEAPVEGGVISGVDRGIYPLPRTYVFGLEVSF